MTKKYLYYCCTLALFTDLVTIADGYQAIEDITTTNITCYKCSAKDSWCFYINEYLCDDKNSDYCNAEFGNAINNGNLDYFYHRCSTKGDLFYNGRMLSVTDQPLKTRCKLCCNAPAAGSYVFSVLKDCYANEKCDGIYDPAFSSIRCVCETDLSNAFESCNSVNMIKNDLLSILASLYFLTFLM